MVTGAVPSELSDAVPVPFAAPNINIPVLQHTGADPQDRRNWSDVVEFRAGNPPTVQMLSEGCGNPINPLDISCFPVGAPIRGFATETPTGTGNDFNDCTRFTAVDLTGQPFATVMACSDSPAIEAGDTGPPVPEVPLAVSLPIAAIGLVAVFAVRRRRPTSS